MSTVQIICMLLGVCLLMFLAYKGMNLFLATVLCALFVCFTNGIPWTDGVIAGYAAAFSGFVKANLFVIVTGAIFGQMMSSSGCAESIALKVLSMLGRKRMILGLLLVNMLFCYVGIAGFVVIFTIAPLAIIMFEKAQLPRWMIPTVTSLGTSIGCGVLPYSLDILNYTPTRFLGTTLGAAPLLGFVAGGVTFAFGYAYCLRVRSKYYKSQGVDTALIYSQPMDLAPSREGLPPWYLAAVPFLVVVASSMISSKLIDSTSAVAISLTAGAVLALLVGLRQKTITFQGGVFTQVFTEGANKGILALTSASVVVGFGGVVQMTQAFNTVVQKVLSIDLHPYASEVISLNVVSGLLGSSPAAEALWMESLAQNYVALGALPEVIHRLAPITALGFNTLPHCAAVAISLAYYGLSYKEGYKGMFFTSVIGPIIGAVATMLVAMVLYPIG